MWNMLWPILIVVGANTIYNISAKSTPASINAFASLALTYLIAALSAVVLFFATSHNKNIIAEIAKTNRTALFLGISIVGLEFGYICIYRAGWKVSTASLVANIALACVLLIIGFWVYKESLSLRQIIGMMLCIAGLVLIAK